MTGSLSAGRSATISLVPSSTPQTHLRAVTRRLRLLPPTLRAGGSLHRIELQKREAWRPPRLIPDLHLTESSPIR
eukprot:scaffold778_cov263-Pinguiococcus_pyrenoidosus.AAC.13